MSKMIYEISQPTGCHTVYILVRTQHIFVTSPLVISGVTSYCPTVVTSSSDNYRRVLPHLGPSPGGPDCGAEILGAHLEGPFISRSVEQSIEIETWQQCSYIIP